MLYQVVEAIEWIFIVQLIYRSGYYWIILALQKTYFPIGIFLASGFTIKKVQKTLHAFA
jgi:hypothetical protein